MIGSNALSFYAKLSPVLSYADSTLVHIEASVSEHESAYEREAAFPNSHPPVDAKESIAQAHWAIK